MFVSKPDLVVPPPPIDCSGNASQFKFGEMEYRKAEFDETRTVLAIPAAWLEKVFLLIREIIKRFSTFRIPSAFKYNRFFFSHLIV